MILAIVCASASSVPLIVLATKLRPSAMSAIIGILTVAFAVGSVAFWLTHWPTRRQSRILAVTGVLSTACWSLVQPNAAFAAMACGALVVTGAYIALFHSPRVLLLDGTTIAQHPSGITASIGTASAELRLLCNGHEGPFVEELVILADTAMYAAKRRGGNQARASVGS